MAKDWITGRSWNTGGGGGSPFAMAAIGLLQALQNNRREDERKEEYERMMQEKKAMQEIQTGRTLMERIAQMDPALWGDQGFVDAWKAGDTTYLAKIGWKPKAAEPEEVDYEKTFKQAAYRKLQNGEPLSETEKVALGLADKPSTGYGTAAEGNIIFNKGTGETLTKNPKTFAPPRPSGGGGGGGAPAPAGKRKAKTSKDYEIDGRIWRVSFDEYGEEIGRQDMGPAPKKGDDVDPLSIPPAPPSAIGKIGSAVMGGIRNIFKDDSEEELEAFKKALQ